MAVDTSQKRAALLTLRGRHPIPVTPDGSIDVIDRGALAGVYYLSGGDVTAPVLSSPTASETGQTTGNGQVSTDEGNGTLYWVVTQSATTPSVAQIQAGQDHTGAAADDSGNQAVTATGGQSANAAGLTASTAYYFHFQHQDAATNDSSAVTSAQFTTSALSSGAIHMIGIRARRKRTRRK